MLSRRNYSVHCLQEYIHTNVIDRDSYSRILDELTPAVKDSNYKVSREVKKYVSLHLPGVAPWLIHTNC